MRRCPACGGPIYVEENGDDWCYCLMQRVPVPTEDDR